MKAIEYMNNLNDADMFGVLESMEIKAPLILEALDLIDQGEKYISDLETVLEAMSLEERKELAELAVKKDLKVPMIVLYDYANQKWLVD